MPKASTQVYMLDRKILNLFRPHTKGRKNTKCDQFFCPTSDFFDFCNPCFFYLYQRCEFCWQSSCRNCDHSLFTLQFCYIDKFTYKSTVPLAKFNLGLLFTSALRACMNSRPSLNFTSGIIIFHHSPHEQSIYVYYSSKMSTSTYCTIW